VVRFIVQSRHLLGETEDLHRSIVSGQYSILWRTPDRTVTASAILYRVYSFHPVAVLMMMVVTTEACVSIGTGHETIPAFSLRMVQFSEVLTAERKRKWRLLSSGV
jgi:hypothetical protein